MRIRNRRNDFLVHGVPNLNRAIFAAANKHVRLLGIANLSDCRAVMVGRVRTDVALKCVHVIETHIFMFRASQNVIPAGMEGYRPNTAIVLEHNGGEDTFLLR